jgi:hypothetical protein
MPIATASAIAPESQPTHETVARRAAFRSRIVDAIPMTTPPGRDGSRAISRSGACAPARA